MLKEMRTAVFDMDGTVLDSMPYWREQSYRFILSQGITPTEEERAHLRLLSGMMVADWLQTHYGMKDIYAQLSEESCRGMEAAYAAGIALKPGVRAYLERLGGRGVERVLATATPARLALIALNRADLTRCFDRICTTDTVGCSKGKPEFFTKLLVLTGARAEETVLFEDSLYAIRTAAQLGIRSVGVADRTNLLDREAISEASLAVIENFDALP